MVVFGNEIVLFSQEYYDTVVRLFAGHEVQFRYVRDERLYVGRAMIPDPPARGRPRLERVASVAHRWGARVTWASPSIEGALKLEGSTIAAMDGHAVTSRDHIRELLRFRRAGDVVTLTIRSTRGPESQDIQLTLGEREEPTSL
jgi:hypothetical protein